MHLLHSKYCQIVSSYNKVLGFCSLNQRWRKSFQNSVFIGCSFRAVFWLEERAQEFVSTMCFHSMCTVFSLYVYWGGFGVGGATEDDGRSKAPCHPWCLLALMQKDSINHLEVCLFCTCLKKGRSTLGKFLKTVFHLLFFQENMCQLFHFKLFHRGPWQDVSQQPRTRLNSAVREGWHTVIWKYFCFFMFNTLLNKVVNRVGIMTHSFLNMHVGPWVVVCWGKKQTLSGQYCNTLYCL